eukprot:1760065-Prymnesium_polylepis.1
MPTKTNATDTIREYSSTDKSHLSERSATKNAVVFVGMSTELSSNVSPMIGRRYKKVRMQSGGDRHIQHKFSPIGHRRRAYKSTLQRYSTRLVPRE